MADPSSASGGSTTTKTAVICPGETVVLKRRITILNTILENGAQASTPCEGFLINQSIQDRINYGFYFEWVEEQDCSNQFTGISVAGVNYDFSQTFDFCDDDNGFKTVAGLDKLYEQITAAVPNGDVLFTKVNTEYNFYGGPASDSARDNMRRLMLTVGSFSTIMGSKLDQVYLYGLGIANWSFTGITAGEANLKFRVYPIELV